MPADDVTLGEVRRSLDKLDRRVAEGQKNTDDRLAQLASKMVPADLWAAEHKALEGDLAEHTKQASLDRDRLERDLADLAKRHERDMKALREELALKAAKRTEWSRQVKIAVFGVGGALLAALLSAWVSALLTAKGIK